MGTVWRHDLVRWWDSMGTVSRHIIWIDGELAWGQFGDILTG